MNRLAVCARGMRKSYGRSSALEAFDLDVGVGEIYGLIGPDGAGKSSFMKAVAGVLQYDAGTLTVLDIDMQYESGAELAKAKLGFMPQGLGQNLYPELSIEENVDFFAQLRLVPPDLARSRKEQLFAMTRLAAFRDRPVKQLSGGMQQKLGLVCTLIHAPQLIILDEPTTGVDPVSRRDFWAILSELLQENGATALVSTAYMDEASAFDRVTLMHAGRALMSGLPEQVRAHRPGTVVTASGLSSDMLERLSRQFGYLEPRGLDWRLFVDGRDEGQTEIELKQVLGADVRYTISEPDLEDAFIAMVKGNQTDTAWRALPAPDPTAVPAIEARGLCKTFGEFHAVDHASFEVRPGEVFGLLGANGAGKTTVIKMLTGIQKPSAGEGRVAGADMLGAGRAIKTRIGYMSQAFSLYTDLTATENIRLYAAIYGLDREQARKRIEWVVEMAGLAGHEHSLAVSLPMGLRQRLALGCALVHQPQVLFLDEPTSGVDPVGRRAFWDILFTLAREQRVAILVTTHYMSEAERCDRLALMYAGKVVAAGSPAALKTQLTERRGHLLALDVSDARTALALLRTHHFDVALHGRRLHLFAPEPVSVLAAAKEVLNQASITLLQTHDMAPAMEDVFVALMTELEQAR